MLTAIHDPASGPMRVAGLMSGSGTNLRRILERQHELASEKNSPFEVVVIFSDNAASQANTIGRDFDIPVVTRDIGAFYKKRARPRSDLQLRAEFDRATVKALAPFQATVAAYAGYMSIVTEALIEAFLGINVHPADLSVMDGDRRKYTGDHAVRDAILAGEGSIRSCTHIIETEVDGGRLMMISPPLEVKIPDGLDLSNPDHHAEIEDDNQERLKEAGDWLVFPRTLEEIARGRFALDEMGQLHFNAEPIPAGLRLEK